MCSWDAKPFFKDYVGKRNVAKSVIQDAFSFELRARSPRRNFCFAFLLVYPLVSFVLGQLWNTLYAVSMSEMLWTVCSSAITVAAVVVFLFGLALTVRRLHDVGRSAAWLILLVLPVIGFFGMIFLGLMASAEGANRYGANPYGAALPDFVVSELDKLSQLKDKGFITEQEYEQKKKQLLGI